jgi:hypothetical protein
MSMRLFKVLLVATLIVSTGAVAFAELQNVSVNGNIRIRGDWYENAPGNKTDSAFVEQRTRLGVKADFTDNVTSVIEFDDYSNWGDDFRSPNYVTGVDTRNAIRNGNGQVAVYQAYIEAKDMWGTGLQLKVGRQEMKLGSQWLMGVNDNSARFYGLSFDAACLSYVFDDLGVVHALWFKNAETQRDFSEGDMDGYGLYATCTAVQDVTFDAYWLYIREDGNNARRGPLLQNINLFGQPAKRLELHTMGVRAAGKLYGFDFELENAYQFGYVGTVKSGSIDYSTTMGINSELGYQFDCKFQPRPFVGFAAFMALDKGDSNKMAFNRLFSNWQYSEFLDINKNLSNCFVWRAGASMNPFEALKLSAVASVFKAYKDQGDTNVDAVETGLYATYKYTEDLLFRAGYAHLWPMEGSSHGNLISGNGLLPAPTNNNTNMNYMFLETEISF